MPVPVDPSDSRSEKSDSFLTSDGLIRRAKRDDPEAWQRLVKLYSPRVYQLCSQSGLDADTIVQDVFLKVWQALPKFEFRPQEKSFRPWLRMIVKHAVVDHWRRDGNRPDVAWGGTTGNTVIENLLDPNENSSGDSPWSAFDDSILSKIELVHCALQMIQSEFKPNTLEAFRLTVIENLSIAETAAKLGISETAVRIARSRVLKRLREELEQLDGL